MLTCKEASRLLSQSMDGQLPPRKRLELRLHVWICRSCANFEKHLKYLRKAVKEMQAKKSRADGAGLDTEARERIRKALRERT